MWSVILEVAFEHLWRVRLQAGCTWMMASLRSTSLSWFCEMISISLRRSSTLTSRISLRLHGHRSEMSDARTGWPQHNMLPLGPARLGCSCRVRGARSGPKPWRPRRPGSQAVARARGYFGPAAAPLVEDLEPVDARVLLLLRSSLVEHPLAHLLLQPQAVEAVSVCDRRAHLSRRSVCTGAPRPTLAMADGNCTCCRSDLSGGAEPSLPPGA